MDLKVSKWIGTSKFNHQDIIDDFISIEAEETAHQTAEAARVTAENTRAAQETSRQNAEGTRQSTFEANEVTRQSGFDLSESTRISNEQTRINHETIRNDNEATRQNNESNRVSAEDTRISNESGRVTAEGNRVNAETNRASVEESRVTAESGRVTAENLRASSETSRASNENTRVSSEETRVSNESSRTSAETARNTAEQARINNEASRILEFNSIAEHDLLTETNNGALSISTEVDGNGNIVRRLFTDANGVVRRDTTRGSFNANNFPSSLADKQYNSSGKGTKYLTHEVTYNASNKLTQDVVTQLPYISTDISISRAGLAIDPLTAYNPVSLTAVNNNIAVMTNGYYNSNLLNNVSALEVHNNKILNTFNTDNSVSIEL